MTKNYISLSLSLACITFSSVLFAQDQFRTDFEPIRTELVSWDPVRGEWLSSSLIAMSKNEPVPDRYFPEDLTPVEMLRSLPPETRNRVSGISNERARANSRSDQWQRVNSAIERVNCSPVMGRSYGDPHLTSFDGVNNSFQTVGEFVLVESASRNMIVQVRQKSISDDVSVSTAVAMSVAGDRVGIYGSDYPDGNNTTPIRINGEPVYMEGNTYYLPHGGTIEGDGKKLGRSYTVTWPTGETVKVSGGSQMNIAVQVYPCVDRYNGILGNANGNRGDEFTPRGVDRGFGELASVDFGDPVMTDDMQREYLAFMSKDFGMSWRITQQESLFDYDFNESTMTFTDYSYPRVHRTINDLSQNDRDRARRECERSGIRGSDLNGCIYDVGFARIPPSPRPTIPDRTTGRVYKPVTDPVPNVNPGNPRTGIPAVRKEDGKLNTGTGNTAQPIGTMGGNGTTVPGTIEKAPASKPVTDSKVSGTEPSKPVVKQIEPVKAPEPYYPPIEEERPRKTFGGSTKSNSSTPSNSGSGSSSPAPVSTPAPVSRPEPVSRPVVTPKVETPRPVNPSAPSTPKVTTPPRVTGPVKIGRG